MNDSAQKNGIKWDSLSEEVQEQFTDIMKRHGVTDAERDQIRDYALAEAGVMDSPQTTWVNRDDAFIRNAVQALYTRSHRDPVRQQQLADKYANRAGASPKTR